MNSSIRKEKKEKIHHGSGTMYHLSLHTLPHNHQLAEHKFFTIYMLILDMILMSEKMMSQTITDEFIYVSV
jgi:hypothetical protein